MHSSLKWIIGLAAVALIAGVAVCGLNGQAGPATLLTFCAVGLVATYYQEGDTLSYTPSTAVTAGTPIQLADGRVGIPNSDIAADALGTLRIKGVFLVAADTATTWADGDELWYDSSAGEVIPKSLALDGAADFRLGLAVGAKASGPTSGYVQINAWRPLDPVVYEFDCQTGVDGDAHILIPASQNPNGLVITSIFALVTEQFAGTEDQGVVTVRDESNNTLATLTPSDSGADAVNDVIEGYFMQEVATGAAGIVVAAGEYVDGQVTTPTTGSAAGKMKVYITAVPLK